MDDEELDEYENDGSYQYNNLPSNKQRKFNNNKVPKRLQQLSHNQNIQQANKRNTKSIDVKKDDNDATSLKQKMSSNKQKNSGLLSRIKKNNKKNNESEKNSNSNNTSESNTSETEENGLDEEVVKAKKVRLTITFVSAGLSFLFVFIIIILIVSVFLSFVGVPASASSTYGTNEFQSIYEKGTVGYQNEINYYKKLKQVASTYKDKCGGELNENYIHASLIYYYYQVENPLSNDDEVIIDYAKMSNMMDTVVSLMYDSKTCFVDYAENGEFYNNLKNSSSFKNYYSNVLKNESIDETLQNIFNLAEDISVKDDYIDNSFIPEDTQIEINKSTAGNTSSSSSNGSSGGSSSSSNKNSNVTSISFKDYLLGVLYANVSSEDLLKTEKVKALVIIYTTNILSKNNLSTNTQTISFNNVDNEILYCNPDEGCSYVISNGQTSLQAGGGAGGNGNNTFYAGKYYYRMAMDSSLKTTLSNIINDIYGNILVDSTSNPVLVDISKINNVEVSNYSDILKKAYSDLTIKNVRENVYDNGVNYGNKKVSTPTIAYDQADYDNVIFCGRTKPKATIKTSGCGVTAMAIIVSTYENDKKYDPVAMMNAAYKGGYCGYGISGTSVGFFQKEAKTMGYKYLKVGKSKTSDKNLVLSHLSSGHLIIAHMGPGKFTNGGHYIVLSGIDPENKKVYVTDPYNRRNKINLKSGNGWYSFNDIIVKQAKAFYIIWKG